MKYQFWAVISFFMILQSSGAIAYNLDAACYNRVADIVFVLDSSNSIWPQDFQRQIDFVEKVISSFQIDKDHIQVGVLTFSNVLRLDFHLNQYHNKNYLKKAIRAIPYLGGGTETGKAIEFARDEMFREVNGGRVSAAQFIVVITDGLSQDVQKTALEASIARSDGIVMFAIGVGQGADTGELNRIASVPNNQYVFEVDSYSDLISITDILTQRACEEPVNDEPVQPTDAPVVTEEPRSYCGGKPADIYFVVDASSSIWFPDFEKQLDFVKDVIDVFDIGPNKTRIGVVAYSDGIHPTIFLNSYYDRQVLKERISNTPHLTGGTNTASAIKYVREQGFGTHRARKGVAHIMILLTDGQSDHLMNTAEEARQAKNDGIYIFTIGVGDNIDRQELVDIASEPKEEFSFTVNDFDALSSLNNILAIQTCKVNLHPGDFPRDYQECVISGPTDVVFMFDSNSVSGRHAHKLKTAVRDLSLQMGERGNDVRFGFLTNECSGERELLLEDYKNIFEFSAMLNASPLPEYSALLHKLRHRLFSSEHGGRSSQKLSVLFIDHEIDDPMILVEAHRAKFQGIHIFVVAIGGNIDERRIEALTSRPSKHYHIKLESYAELGDRNMDILQKICSVL